MLNIGRELREARERLGLGLEACERATRIRSAQLQAMEDERFDRLPEPAYTRGFLRSYARLLGLDADRLVAEYDRISGLEALRQEHTLRPLPPRTSRVGRLRGRVPLRPPSPAHRLRWLAIGGVGGVLILAWTGLSGGGSPKVPLPTTSTSPAVAPTTPAPSQPSPVNEPVAAPAPRPRHLVFAVTGLPPNGCYLEVRRGGSNGALLYQGTVAPGTSRRWRAGSQLWVRAGWTPGLRASINGRPVTLTGGTASFLVRRSGARQVA